MPLCVFLHTHTPLLPPPPTPPPHTIKHKTKQQSWLPTYDCRYSTYNDSTHGWLDSDYIVPLFTTYADACFSAFSDRVKHWTTFNEPHSFCFSVRVTLFFVL